MANEEKGLSLSEISALIAKEKLNWTAGKTSLSSLSLAEQKNYLGVIVTKSELQKLKSATNKQAEEELKAFKAGPAYGAPAAKDWRNISGKNYITAVKDQGGCGSCVSFGTCAAIEATARIKAKDHNLNVDLSEAFMQFCGGGSCSGWGLTSGLQFAKSTGVTDDGCFRYQPENLPCENRCSSWQSRLLKLKTFTSHGSMPARKEAIAAIGPVVAGMAVYNDFFSYSSGIYQKTSGSTLSGYHCICVVGYDDTQQCWIIKNSWGTGWGESGFCRIKYNQPDLLIDTDWAFYSVDPEVEPTKGSGTAKYILVDKHFSGSVVLWAYVKDKWRHKIITDVDLAGIAQEIFTANRVDVWWDNNEITLVRPWKTL